MKQTYTHKLLALAFCMAQSFCSAQQSNPQICRLGGITNDSLLPYVQSLMIDCNKDLKLYFKKSKLLTGLRQLELTGDTNAKEWELLFSRIKLQPSVKTVIFNKNSFTELPYGYEGLSGVEDLSFKNNDELHYPSLIDQLALLPNVRDLSLEVVTIFELPVSLEGLKNIQILRIINTDEAISKNDTTFFYSGKQPVTYDYYVQKADQQLATVKYTALAGEIDSDEYKELAKRFKTTTNLNESGSSGIKYRNVQPPIAGIDVKRTIYMINPQIENTIMYPSGTKIRIPANTFADRNGNPVTTTVALGYREFRDAVDILVSGIPMKYDSANTVSNFESAGMFELTASSNNEQLSVAGDKRIDMNFVTTSKDPTYNFYAFNDNSGNWEYKEKPKTVNPATAIRFKSPTVAYFNFKNYMAAATRIQDSASLDQRFESFNYVFTLIRNKPGRKLVEFKTKGEKRQRPAAALIRITRVRKTREGDVLFKVRYIPDLHPELSSFNDVYFVCNENISADEFKKKYARKKFYSDIRIYGSNSDLKIKLKDDISMKEIAASAVTVNEKGETKAVNNISRRMKQYNRTLKNRDRTFTRNIRKGKIKNNEITLSNPLQKKMYAYAQIKKQMNADEKKMSFDEWMCYFEEQNKQYLEALRLMNKQMIDSLGKEQASATGLIQSLQLSGTGIYNCDQIQRLENPVEIFAKYKCDDGSKLNTQTTYVIDKHANSAFQYNGSYGYKPSRIAFSTSREAENTLLTIDADGSIAVYKTADFKKQDFTNKSDFDFVVTKINSNFTTVNDLKTLMGF